MMDSGSCGQRVVRIQTSARSIGSGAFSIQYSRSQAQGHSQGSRLLEVCCPGASQTAETILSNTVTNLDAPSLSKVMKSISAFILAFSTLLQMGAVVAPSNPAVMAHAPIETIVCHRPEATQPQVWIEPAPSEAKNRTLFAKFPACHASTSCCPGMLLGGPTVTFAPQYPRTVQWFASVSALLSRPLQPDPKPPRMV